MQFTGRSSDLSLIFPRRSLLEKGKVVAGVTRRTELSAPKWAIQREWGENQTHFLGCLDGFWWNSCRDDHKSGRFMEIKEERQSFTSSARSTFQTLLLHFGTLLPGGCRWLNTLTLWLDRLSERKSFEREMIIWTLIVWTFIIFSWIFTWELESGRLIFYWYGTWMIKWEKKIGQAIGRWLYVNICISFSPNFLQMRKTWLTKRQTQLVRVWNVI